MTAGELGSGHGGEELLDEVAELLWSHYSHKPWRYASERSKSAYRAYARQFLPVLAKAYTGGVTDGVRMAAARQQKEKRPWLERLKR